jgi:polyphosphate kinase 2 (PPK2 family)
MPIIQRVFGGIEEGEFAPQLSEINRLEKMLCDEGVLLLKYWFHLSRGQMRKRLRSWKGPAHALARHRAGVGVLQALSQVRQGVRAVPAPHVERRSAVDHHSGRRSGIPRAHDGAASALGDARADRRKAGQALPDRTPPLAPTIDKLNILRALSSTSRWRNRRTEAAREVAGPLNELSRDPRMQELSVVAVFEGNDAAGKGGAIRRVTGALDARSYSNVSIAAPSEEERAQPYLWRFWRHVPGEAASRSSTARGTGACSSSGSRASAPRPTGCAPTRDQRLRAGALRNKRVIVKFWLAVSKDEQFRRFKKRETIAFKRFKITDEDWRNRKKWDAYERAICDMVDRHRPRSRRGRSSKRTTSTTRGSRCSRP